ncbi:hypothetical protein CLAFUR0_14516 [Fulvia fulva]|nr:hypothetical protein CLAFUR0_14516 [Fulvia fulva]
MHYLVSVSGGCCVETTTTGTLNTYAASSDSQKWQVYFRHTDLNVQVALQNASNSQWLRAAAGGPNGKIETGERQWWTLEKGKAPNSYWLVNK